MKSATSPSEEGFPDDKQQAVKVYFIKSENFQKV